jgi:hypothetical protein
MTLVLPPLRIFQVPTARGSGTSVEPPTENWWSRLTLRKPISFQTSLKLNRAHPGMRAILVHVATFGEPSRLPPISSLDRAAPGLCYRGSISPSGGHGRRRPGSPPPGKRKGV